MTEPKRPGLPVEDRRRLRRMAVRAEQNGQTVNAAYCRGVRDVLNWLTGEDESMSAMLREVTR